MLSSLGAVINYLQELVPHTSQLQFTGEQGIIRTKEFLKLLGSPQNRLKVVHVAGTSGKGSTSFMISSLLMAHGYKTGLHLSPHLLDIRERTEINNELLDEKKYCTYFNEVVPAIEKMRTTKWGTLTYFEALVGFAFYIFEKEKVDYAVMETGLGGKFDGTNTVDRMDKLAIITKIGFDHTKILGNTLTKIAHQKASIIVPKGDLISTQQAPAARDEIKRVVRQNGGHFFLAPEWKGWKQKKMTLGLLGRYQEENAALSLAALSHLSQRDGFQADGEAIRNCLLHLQFKGRFDVYKKNGRILILDGAHNAQKMKAFLTSVHSLFPRQKFTFIIAFKQGKDYKKMLHYIIPFAHKIVITHIFSESQDILHNSVMPKTIKSELNRAGYMNVDISLKKSAVLHLINTGRDACIITGSLYFLGDIYREI